MPTLPAVALLLSLAAPAAPQPVAPDVKTQIIQREKDWSEAFQRNDLKAISLILADEFVGVDGRGFISHKADELEEAKNQDPKTGLVSEVLDEFDVRVYGDTAVLGSRNSARLWFGGSIRDIKYRRTTVWVRRDGRWQCVSFHASRIMETPPPSPAPTAKS